MMELANLHILQTEASVRGKSHTTSHHMSTIISSACKCVDNVHLTSTDDNLLWQAKYLEKDDKKQWQSTSFRCH